jgi:hypothetical protein
MNEGEHGAAKGTEDEREEKTDQNKGLRDEKSCRYRL